MHLGHLQAYWAEHTYPDDSEEAYNLEAKQKQILESHLSLLNYSLQFGYSFAVWKQIVNTMLVKDQGVPEIH